MVVDRCGGPVGVAITRENSEQALVIGDGPVSETIVAVIGRGMLLGQGARCLVEGDDRFP